MIHYLLVVCLFLFGCSKDTMVAPPSFDGKIKVLSTTAMIDDIVGKVGGDRIDPICLIRGEIDPHSYELVKGDEEKFSFARIVFFNGLGLEHGASLRYHIEKHPRSVGLGDEIQKRDGPAILKKDGQVDPHIWMDILLWSETIDPIVKNLSAIDPEGASYFEQNGTLLKEEMLKVDQIISKEFDSIPEEKRFLVTSHDAFQYFSRRYLGDGSARCAAPEGLAPDGQLSSTDIQRISDYLTERHVSVVFPESNVSKDSLHKIVSVCQEKGVRVKIAKEILYADALGSLKSDADTYLKMMQHNAKVLLDEWRD